MRVFKCFLFPFCLFILTGAHAQNAGPLFASPDTVCVGQMVNLVNSTPGTTFYWNFCTANTTYLPTGFNAGNPSSNMSSPKFVTLVKDNPDCYSFITSPGNAGVIRNYHGTTFGNAPVTSTFLGSAGILTNATRGIQVLNDGGTWQCFVANGTQLIRMTFSGGLSANPVVTDLVFGGLTAPEGLVIVNDGTQWIGFCVDRLSNNLYRLTFGPSLAATPVITNLFNPGQFNAPTGIALIKENGNWYLFVCNAGNNTLSRIDFGASLLNINTGTNLGNVGSLDHCTGISLIHDCGHLTGFVVNNAVSPDPLVQLEFNGGVAGTVTGIPIGNIGGLNTPYGISETRRIGDTVYMYITNEANSTMSQLYFPVCNASSIPSSTLQTPPPFSYSTPGTYNIILTVDEGLPTEQVFCNNIVVIPQLTVSLGNDQVLCDGNGTTLDPGPGYTSYQWNTGSTAQTLYTDTTGIYWVKVTNKFNCEAYDTVSVLANSTISTTIDTSLCYGTRIFAEGNWQTTAGTYRDTLVSQAGCDSVIITNVAFKPEIKINIGSDTVFCQGDLLILDAATPGGSYLWQDGSADSLYQVDGPGVYWAEVTVDACTVTDSVTISDCPVEIWFPNAFTPDNDGLNDTFRPRGVSISKFRMMIYDRWGALVFETDDINNGWNGSFKGVLCEPDVYTFVAWYESLSEPGKAYKNSGTVTLVR